MKTSCLVVDEVAARVLACSLRSYCVLDVVKSYEWPCWIVISVGVVKCWCCWILVTAEKRAKREDGRFKYGKGNLLECRVLGVFQDRLFCQDAL